MDKKLWLFPLITVDYNAYLRGTGTKDTITADRYEKVRKYDMYSKFSGMIVQKDGEPPEFGTKNGELEKDILEGFWAWYQGPRTAGLSGWRINDLVWPKIVNRSLANGISIPMSASLQPGTGKWNDCHFYDLFNVYKFGSFDRPEMPLHVVMEMWLGEPPNGVYSWVSEEGLGMAMATPNAAMDIYAHVQNYVAGMQKVVDCYGR